MLKADRAVCVRSYMPKRFEAIQPFSALPPIHDRWYNTSKALIKMKLIMSKTEGLTERSVMCNFKKYPISRNTQNLLVEKTELSTNIV